MRREFLQVFHGLIVDALHRQHEARGQRNVPGSDAHLAALGREGVQREHGFFALGEIGALVRGKIVQEGPGQDVWGVEAIEDGLHCYEFSLQSVQQVGCAFFLCWTAPRRLL